MATELNASTIDRFNIEELRKQLVIFLKSRDVPVQQRIWIIYNIAEQGLFWIDARQDEFRRDKRIKITETTSAKENHQWLKEFCKQRLRAANATERSVGLGKRQNKIEDEVQTKIEVEVTNQEVRISYTHEAPAEKDQPVDLRLFGVEDEWTIEFARPPASISTADDRETVDLLWQDSKETTHASQDSKDRDSMQPPSTNAQPATTASAQQD